MLFFPADSGQMPLLDPKSGHKYLNLLTVLALQQVVVMNSASHKAITTLKKNTGIAQPRIYCHSCSLHHLFQTNINTFVLLIIPRPHAPLRLDVGRNTSQVHVTQFRACGEG
jgi:hypothetical protein